MKVLHVIPSISKHAGGPSQAILPMCRALRSQGVELLLATTDDGVQGEDGIAIQCGQAGEYNGQPTIFFPSQLGASFKYSRPFAQWLNHNVAEYDLVHIHAVFNHACIAAARACSRRAVPYIVRPLGTLDPWAMNQKSLRKRVFWHGGVKGLLSSAAAVHYTARTEQMATEQSLGLNHGVVIPLGVDLPQKGGPVSRNVLAQRLPSLGEHPYVLVLSRLLPTKGLDVLLEAFLLLVKQNDFAGWRLVFAGEGPTEYVAGLRRSVAAADAAEQVLFPGWLDRQQKDAALSNASLLALPSYHENFGLCVMEALACGVPVLVSPQVNLAADIETAGAGWIAEIDKEALQSALVEALNSEAERVQRGAKGRLLAGEFSWTVIGRSLTDLYSSILEGNARETALQVA